jgi:DNA-directed RNA polymerase subunit H (RpoH/RPB5)
MPEDENNASENEITIDIFKNKLVPPAKILSDEEKVELKKKFNISSSQLPRISASDPVSKVLKAKGGDIIEFNRNLKLAGLSKYYRIVVGGGS